MSDYPIRACGKLCFTSRRQARNANVNARFRLFIYHCKDCNAYHVANGDRRKPMKDW